jgi:two-component system response regulator PilR (NtrC family)
LAERLVSAEREEILRAMEEAGGVRRKAAEILGISYRGLGKKMARLGIETDRAGSPGGSA